MNTKTLFTFNSIVALLFALPMMLTPQLVIEMYSVHPSQVNDTTWVVTRAYGSLLFSLGVCLWYVRNASPSRAVKGILLLAFIGDILLSLIHTHAILKNIENNQAWGIVIIGLILTVWSGLLLRKVQFSE